MVGRWVHLWIIVISPHDCCYGIFRGYQEMINGDWCRSPNFAPHEQKIMVCYIQRIIANNTSSQSSTCCSLPRNWSPVYSHLWPLLSGEIVTLLGDFFPLISLKPSMEVSAKSPRIPARNPSILPLNIQSPQLKIRHDQPIPSGKLTLCYWKWPW